MLLVVVLPNQLAAGPFVVQPTVVVVVAAAYKPAAGLLVVVAAAGGAIAGLANLPAAGPIAAASWLAALAELGSKG